MTVGNHLRAWRQRRRMSQLDLALEAGISTRHLSFVETGRSQPSREMVLHLAEHLDVPLRERNHLLLAAGSAPRFPERSLDDPAFAPARQAIERILVAYEPFPALAVDRHWTLVAGNRMIALFLDGIDARLLEPPLNVVRLSLHPEGLAGQIANYRQWRAHLVERLRQQIAVSADPVLAALLDEVEGYPFPDASDEDAVPEDFGGVAIPLRLRSEHGILSAYSTTTVFGTPVDVTLSELAIEAFLPADTATADALRRFAGQMDAAGEGARESRTG